MSTHAVRSRPLTVDEYLRLEEISPVRHELVGGELFALAGATIRHNEILFNLARRLGNAAEGTPCRVHVSEVKLRVARDTMYYPDVMVVCGPRGEDPLVIDDPCLVVEVLSPSTETIDRREKLGAYKRIPGLRAYVIVYQDRRRVERHWRDSDGATWRAEAIEEGSVPFPCPGTELTIEQIYQDVRFTD